VIAFWNRREDACYKIMFMLGVVGMITHFQVAVLFGWFMISGMVYCMKPILVYFIGCSVPGCFYNLSTI
jgi:hypothetical protein